MIIKYIPRALPSGARSQPIFGRIVITSILLFALTACGGEEAIDLEKYVAEVKARQKGRIPALPKALSFEVFTYNDTELRDPFVPVSVVEAEGNINDELSPDMDREKDVLEQYALGSLKMMGSIEKKGQRWALIRASDGTLYRTKIGRHLGQNNGEIIMITESQLKLREIVQDGLGGYIERFSTLAVSE